MTGRPTAARSRSARTASTPSATGRPTGSATSRTIKTVSFKVDNPILGTRQLGPSTDTLSNQAAGGVPQRRRRLRRRRPADRVPHQRDDRPSGSSSGIYADAAGHPGQLLGAEPGDRAHEERLEHAVARRRCRSRRTAVLDRGPGQRRRAEDPHVLGRQGHAGQRDRSVRNTDSLPATWRTDKVYKNDGPLSAYAVPLRLTQPTRLTMDRGRRSGGALVSSDERIRQCPQLMTR